jgi:hypothetical protein
MAQKEEKPERECIVIEVSGTELRFEKELAMQRYDEFINVAASGKMAKAANNYCVSVVHREDLVAFRELKKQNPSVAVQIAAELGDCVAPEVEITVKKR